MATLTSAPATLDLEIYRGDTFSMSVWVTDSYGEPLDLTGYSAKLSVYAAANGPVKISLTSVGSGIDIPTQTGVWKGEWQPGDYAQDDVVHYDKLYWIALQATSAAPPQSDEAPTADWGYSPLGRMDIEMTSTDTESLTPFVYYYDLELQVGATVKTYLRGRLSVEGDITL